VSLNGRQAHFTSVFLTWNIADFVLVELQHCGATFLATILMSCACLKGENWKETGHMATKQKLQTIVPFHPKHFNVLQFRIGLLRLSLNGSTPHLHLFLCTF
jgi:hypothetical protein